MSEYVYGIHPVEEILAGRVRPIERIWIQKGAQGSRIRNIVEAARCSSVDLRFEERRRMDRMVPGGRHQGVIVQCGRKETLSLDALLERRAPQDEDPFFLILDRVEDPGNLGAVIRTAAAAGVHGLILPSRKAAPLSGVVSKRSAGALDRLPVCRVTNLVRAMEALKARGVWIIGASAGASQRYTDVDLKGPVALLIGGERGIRRLVREACDAVVSIPMQGATESLNLSVAAALLLYEVRRSRDEGGQ